MGDIIKRAKDTGEPRTLRHGRKRKTTPQDVKIIIRNSVKNRKITSKNLQRDPALASVNVASSTVQRRLLKVGRTARRPLRKQLFTKAMKKNARAGHVITLDGQKVIGERRYFPMNRILRCMGTNQRL